MGLTRRLRHGTQGLVPSYNSLDLLHLNLIHLCSYTIMMEKTIYMLIYVDDIIVASSSSQTTDQLLQQIHKEFAIKDLGNLHHFLQRAILTQRKYIGDLLQRANMENCKNMSTPMADIDRLSKTKGAILTIEETTQYKSIIGALQYLTLTRPDKLYSVNKVCQFLQSPTNKH